MNRSKEVLSLVLYKEQIRFSGNIGVALDKGVVDAHEQGLGQGAEAELEETPRTGRAWVGWRSRCFFVSGHTCTGARWQRQACGCRSKRSDREKFSHFAITL